MSIDFIVIFKLYILIIIVILMRKYYTLVQYGRQEGVGAGNEDVSALLPAFETDITKDILPNRTFNTVFAHIYYYCQGHFLSHYERLKCFTCIAVSIVKGPLLIFFPPDSQLPSHFTVSTSAPLLAPTITNTDMYVYIWMIFFRLYHCLH